MASRREFGSVERLPSGRFRARYRHPATAELVKAPTTFDRVTDARSWLARERVRLEQSAADDPRGVPKAPVETFGAYADDWLANRRTKAGPLRASTRRTYRFYLDNHILPAFGATPLDRIGVQDVRSWYSRLLPNRPTLRARTYALLSTIMATAVADDLISANPCRVRGASTVKPATEAHVLTPTEVNALAAAMPPALALGVHLGAWCQLRVGEILELRRRDIVHGAVRIRRATTWVDGHAVVDDPKTGAGIRDVAIPPHIIPLVETHLAEFTAPGVNSLLFPASDEGEHRSLQGYAYHFARARKAAGLPYVRQHHLRHTGLTLAAQSGATVAELMGRAGHSTPGAAMRYQHASAERDRALAAALSDLAAESR